MNEPLDLERVMALVADTLERVMLGVDYASAAAAVVQQRRPTRRELAAARRQNLELYSGGPDLTRYGVPSLPVPPDVLRLRNAIDEVLAAAEVLSAPDS